MRNAGYNVNWSILNAADYGVPQKRKRLFIIGSRSKTLFFPNPTHGIELEKKHIGTFEALGDQPIGEAPNCPVKFAKNPDLRPSPYAGHIYNGGGRPIDPVGPCHTIIAASGGHKTHWIDTLGIAKKYHEHLKNGGLPWEGEVQGARRLSVEESAIIQSFPRGMIFTGARSAQYKQVGDAVPPLLAAAIAKAVRAQLEGIASAADLMQNTMDQKNQIDLI